MCSTYWSQRTLSLKIVSNVEMKIRCLEPCLRLKHAMRAATSIYSWESPMIKVCQDEMQSVEFMTTELSD